MSEGFLPRASASFRRLNPNLFRDGAISETLPHRAAPKPALVRARARAVAQRDSGDAPVEPAQGATLYTSRVLIRITVLRRQLLDPGNEFVKWLVDCLRYSRIVSDDRLENIALQVEQKKIGREEAEGALIEISPCHRED